jgi:type I restriction enzyme S subunit
MMDRAQLYQHFDALADTSEAVEKLRSLVLNLAVRGLLIPEAKKPDFSPEWRDFCALIDKKRETDNATPAPFEIPKRWRWTNLGQVAEPCGQKKPDVRFTYIDVGAINNVRGLIKSSLEVVAPEDAPSRARKLVRKQSIIYSTVRPYLRNIAVVDRDFSPLPIVSTAFAVLHSKAFLNSRFLFHWLRSQPFQEEVSAKMKGVAYPAISDSEFWRCPIPVPPPAEQQRIVAKVDELLALCDELEARQTTVRERRTRLVHSAFDHLTAAPTREDFRHHAAFVFREFPHLTATSDAIPTFRQAILSLAIQGRLVPQDPNDEPASEQLAKIFERNKSRYASGEIRLRKKTRTEPRNEAESSIPDGWLRVALGEIADVNWGNTSLTKKSYSESGYTAYSATGPDGLIGHAEFSVPGIVLSAIGARSGKCFLAEGKWTAIKNTITIIPFYPINNGWLFRAINLETAWKKRGGAQPFIALKDAISLLILLPPLAEQRRIVAKVEELMRWCDQLEAQLTAAQTAATHLLDATIRELLAM